MYRYVFKRVKDTFEFGVSIRKSYACQQVNSVNNKNDNQQQQQQQQCQSVIKTQEINFLSSNDDQRKNYDDFKRKYSCKHPNSFNPFLQAITWSTALIAGFYSAQLLCLYRRNKGFDATKSFYARYLDQKNRLLHKKLLCRAAVYEKRRQRHHQSFVPSSSKFQCPFKKSSPEKSSSLLQTSLVPSKKQVHEFQDFYPVFEGFFDKRFEKFYENLSQTSTYKRVYNVNNDTKPKDERTNKQNDDDKKTNENLKEDEAIDEMMSNITIMVGEAEYQVGAELLSHGNYAEAIDHLRMAANFDHPSAFFNLALLFEQGLGVKKDYNIALRLYESAGHLGHDKALYNLGVFSAKGLGGVKRSFRQAKKYFEKSAALGNSDAIEALSLLLPDKKKSLLYSVPDDFIVTDRISKTFMPNHIDYKRSIAIT